MESKEASMRKYDAQIQRLESEWDRLDSMGNQGLKQDSITKKLDKLRKLKGNWEKLWKKVDEDIQTNPPAQIQSSSKISQDFIDYIKMVENGTKGSLQPKYLKIYMVAGEPHIGYGHKVKPNEQKSFSKGITQDYSEKLLRYDLELSRKKAHEEVKNMFKVNIPLDQRQDEILTDFVFNLGSLKAFPKFTKAVLNKDWKTVSQEYNRKYKTADGHMKDLTARNQAFHDRFLK